MTKGRGTQVDRMARALVWMGRFVKGWLPRTLGGLSALLLLLWGALGDDVWAAAGWALLGSGVLTGALAFLAEVIVQRPSYMELSRLRERAERKADDKAEALERALQVLLVRLGHYCALQDHSDRFSVYYFHEDEFVMLARHPKNPTFAAKGRGRYPAQQGAIGAAWRAEKGQALVTMPADADAWVRAMKNQGLEPSVIDRLSMRSSALAGHRLEAGESSVGVLVFESTVPKRVTQSHLDKVAESHIVAAVAELVAAFAMMTPAGESLAASKRAARSISPGQWRAVPARPMIGPAEQG